MISRRVMSGVARSVARSRFMRVDSAALGNRFLSFAVVDADGVQTTVNAKPGQPLLSVCQDANIAIEASCNGECICSSCHLYVSEDLMPKILAPDEDELDILDLAPSVKDTS